jgi:glycosyltransferase involved in cell wall biosynthesis
MDEPLVSVIVTTRNNHATLDACLASVAAQTYDAIELIVVDRDSTDDTKAIARRYTKRVYNRGPERSAQRNFAVQAAQGQYVAIIDSDMELEPEVVAACVAAIHSQPDVRGVIIPEESFGEGFWARCKRLERSFYVGIDWIEAARFFARETYLAVGGYDPQLVSGEDWDLSTRVANVGKLARVRPFIHHNEGRLSLRRSLSKKAYYARQARAYFAKHPTGSKLTAQAGPLQRYKLFFSKPNKLLDEPVTAAGMLFMKTCEFAWGAAGYLSAGRQKGEA